MNQYNGYGFEPIAAYNPLRDEEKRKVKKISNLIGAVFIVMWLLPDIINSLLSDIIKLYGGQEVAASLFADPAFIMGIQTVYSLLLFTLPFLIIPIGLGKRVSDLCQIRRPREKLFTPFVFIGVGVSAFANLVTNQISAVFESLGIYFLSPDIDYPEGIFGFALSFLAVAVMPALVEEFATRGMVMGAARDFGETFGLICSAIFFALMHGNLVQIPFAFIMGLVIGYAVIKTGSIITGMAIHFINNAFSVAMTYTMDKIESVIAQSIIYLGYLVVCVLLFFVGVFLAQRRKDKVWSLDNGDSLLKFGEKLKLFIFSPTVIVAIGLTVIDCINMISFG